MESEDSIQADAGADALSGKLCPECGDVERGLVMALREAETALADAWTAIHNEGTEFAKAYHAQVSRHRKQIIDAEEAGYERGLRDARAQCASSTDGEVK